MPNANGSVLALAARLRGLDDEALTRLVAARGVRDHGIRDFFDLAEALLDRASVQRALERLDRGTLAVLAAAAELAATAGAPTADELARRLGIDPGELARRTTLAIEAGLLAEESGRYAPWDAVAEQLSAWPSSGLPTAPELASDPPPAALEPVSASDARFVDRGAGDRAFATLAAVTELLYALRAEPARRLAKGGTALPDARRLATTAAIEPGDVDLLLNIASRAGLADAGADWTASPASEAWLTASRLERWAALARGWRDRLPEELLDLLRQRAHAVWGNGLLDYLSWLYPAGGTWIRERAEQAAREAELLGITGSSTPSTPGAALLLDGPESATAAMAQLLPAEVDRVYLQPDLTLIAPGPLEARLDARLRAFADAEPGGLASSYRVTAESVTRALIAGESASGIREVLSAISLTGIPQPLRYLLDDTSARFGALRVGEVDPGAAAPDAPDARASSYVRSDDTTLLDRILVDQSLAVLALRRTGEHRVVTRFDAGVLYWALADARYAVVAEDASGAVLAMRRERRAGAAAAVSDDTAAILVQRVRAGAAEEPEETGQAWLARQLELAIRNRLTVNVTVRMPDGSEAEYPLEPAAVAGGRLRVRDRRSDIERTLPLSSIVAVAPAD